MTRCIGFNVQRAFALAKPVAHDMTLRRADFAAGRISAAKITERLVSWVGHASHADTYRLRERLFSEMLLSRGDASSVPWDNRR